MKNDYKICGDYAVIHLNSPKYGDKECLVDIEDLEKIKDIRWYSAYNNYTNALYVYGHDSRTTTIRLHRLIMGAPKGLEVDHINHNTFDNRKANLRLCNHSENHQNRKTKNKYGVTGISWDKSRNKWAVRFRINGVNKHVGRYTDLEEAKKAAHYIRANFMPFSQEALKVS